MTLLSPAKPIRYCLLCSRLMQKVKETSCSGSIALAHTLVKLSLPPALPVEHPGLLVPQRVLWTGDNKLYTVGAYPGIPGTIGPAPPFCLKL